MWASLRFSNVVLANQAHEKQHDCMPNALEEPALFDTFKSNQWSTGHFFTINCDTNGADFFQGQLSNLLTISESENRPYELMKSSYAGAMGYGQFMPSSFLDYAVDFDGDGHKDIWGNPDDAIGSVAHYFQSYGWQKDQPVVVPVTLSKDVDEALINTGEVPEKPLSEWVELGVSAPQDILNTYANAPVVLLKMKEGEKVEYLLGFNNYYVITRYNRSRLYANAVFRLAQALRAAYEKEQQGS
jgi:membrane-bound lytic murein transglycosylase B